jgi:hypothetical protein
VNKALKIMESKNDKEKKYQKKPKKLILDLELE